MRKLRSHMLIWLLVGLIISTTIGQEETCEEEERDFALNRVCGKCVNKYSTFKDDTDTTKKCFFNFPKKNAFKIKQTGGFPLKVDQLVTFGNVTGTGPSMLVHNAGLGSVASLYLFEVGNEMGYNALNKIDLNLEKNIGAAFLVDLVGDSKLDIVVSALEDQELIVLENIGTLAAPVFQRFVGDHTLKGAERYFFSFNQGTTHLIDFNGDGKMDILSMDSFNTGKIEVVEVDGNGNYSIRTELSIGCTVSFMVVDLNQDGIMDVVCTSFFGDSNALKVFVGLGENEFYELESNVNPFGLVSNRFDFSFGLMNMRFNPRLLPGGRFDVLVYVPFLEGYALFRDEADASGGSLSFVSFNNPQPGIIMPDVSEGFVQDVIFGRFFHHDENILEAISFRDSPGDNTIVGDHHIQRNEDRTWIRTNITFPISLPNEDVNGRRRLSSFQLPEIMFATFGNQSQEVAMYDTLRDTLRIFTSGPNGTMVKKQDYVLGIPDPRSVFGLLVFDNVNLLLRGSGESFIYYFIDQDSGFDGGASLPFTADATMDLDEDGLDDVVSFVEKSKSIQVYHQNKKFGTFQTEPTIVEVFKDDFTFGMRELVTFHFVDLLGNGFKDDLVVKVFRGLNVQNAPPLVAHLNAGRGCRSGCLGRGFCLDASVPDTTINAIASDRGIDTKLNHQAVGKCWCPPQFTGDSCENCANGFYGTECEFKCPQFSNTLVTIGKFPFPSKLPMLDQCQCNPTFVRTLDDEHNNTFQCVCPPGFGFNAQLSICEKCDLGTYQDKFGMNRCQTCPIRGSTTQATGASSLEECVCTEDRFLSMLDQSCQRCPDNTILRIGNDCPCQQGFYQVDNPFRCEECPSTGVECRTENMTLNTLPVKSGFWRPSATSLDIRACPNPSFCLGTAESTCKENHEGVFCTTCTEGYALGVDGCEECTSERETKDKALTITFIVLVVVLAITPMGWVLYRYHKASETKRNSRRACSCCGLKGTVLPEILKDSFEDISTKFRVTLGFFQVVLQFMVYVVQKDVRNEDGERSLQSLGLVFTEIDVSQILAAFEVGCYVNYNYYVKLLIYTVTPLGFVCLMMFEMFLLKRYGKNPASYDQVRNIMIWGLCYLLLFIYPGVSSALLGVFLKDEFGTIRTLRLDYSINYDSAESQAWRIYTAFMIVIYVIGIPVLFGIFIYWKTYESSKTLYKPYLKQFKWFEIYELLRKLLMTSGFILIDQAYPDGAIFVFVLITAGALFFLQIASPYKAFSNLLLAELSLGYLVLLFFIASSPGATFSMIQRTAIGFSVLQLLTGFILFVLYRASEKKQEEMDKDHVDSMEQESKTFYDNPIHFSARQQETVQCADENENDTNAPTSLNVI